MRPEAGQSRTLSLIEAPSTYESLGFLDVFVAEEELAVQIREVDRVEIHNVDLAEASEDEILEELAADAAGTDHEHARLHLELVMDEDLNVEADLFNARKRRAERLPLKSFSTHLATKDEPTKTTLNEKEPWARLVGEEGSELKDRLELPKPWHAANLRIPHSCFIHSPART